VIAAVAGLVALIWPQQTAQVGRAIVDAPWLSLGIGLLTSITSTALVVALAITICLSPVAALAALALSAAGLFGWIAIGEQVGERLLQALNVQQIAAAFCLVPIGWLMILAEELPGLVLPAEFSSFLTRSARPFHRVRIQYCYVQQKANSGSTLHPQAAPQLPAVLAAWSPAFHKSPRLRKGVRNAGLLERVAGSTGTAFHLD
jgi:hypothetical protein